MGASSSLRYTQRLTASSRTPVGISQRVRRTVQWRWMQLPKSQSLPTPFRPQEIRSLEYCANFGKSPDAGIHHFWSLKAGYEKESSEVLLQNRRVLSPCQEPARRGLDPWGNLLTFSSNENQLHTNLDERTESNAAP